MCTYIYSSITRKRNRDYSCSTILNRVLKISVSIPLLVGREPKQRNDYRDDIKLYYNDNYFHLFIY